jgi:hypothetical protein
MLRRPQGEVQEDFFFACRAVECLGDKQFEVLCDI